MTSTTRYEPRHASPANRADQYLCPLCNAPQDRYQLRVDVHESPRRVDCFGDVCSACLAKLTRMGVDDAEEA
jgi:hypothetical protein